MLNVLGRVPLVAPLLRKIARWYPEGSITTIKSGRAKGMKWRRYHRYVNGYWVGTYELPLQEAIWRLLKPGDVFYDVGANAGFFSLIAARAVGPTGRVVAFEPEPSNAACIAEQLRLNELPQCHVVQKAVGDKSSTMIFRRGDDSSTGRLIAEGERLPADIAVPVITLDGFAGEGNEIPDLVKIDVEGAEVEVLQGAQRLLRSPAPPKLLIEIHPGRASPIGDLLTDAGYLLHQPNGDTWSPAKGSRHVLGLRQK